MSTNLIIGLVGIVIMLALMFCRMWVGPSLMIVSLVGIAIMKDWSYALTLLAPVTHTSISGYTWACLPLFVLMGCAIAHTGMGADLYTFARNYLGKIKGGLAMATTAACAIFAAICGDSVTTAVTMGKVAMPEMDRYNYDKKLSAASITAGGTIGIMIPPSVSFILYGLITEESVGKLFAAGLVPGILQAVFYIVTIYIVCKMRPKMGGEEIHVTKQERRKSILPVWPVLVVFIVMMGGIYGGFFTPTEAGAFASLCVFIIGICLKRVNGKVTKAIMWDTVQSAGMVFFLVIGAYFFIRFMAISGVTGACTDMLLRMHETGGMPRLLIIIIIMLFYFITGCFLDSLAVLLLTLAIVYPVVCALGYDPIWWGVIMVRMLEISMITPPFGLNLFCVSRSTRTPIATLYKGVLPFIAADIVHVVLLVAFPSIALFLPRLMGLM